MVSPPSAYQAELDRPARVPIYKLDLLRPHVNIPQPVAYWKLDETSGTRYDAIGSNHLTDVNAVGYAAGLIGNAAHFVYHDESAGNTDRLQCVIAGGNVLQRGDRSWGGAARFKLASYGTGSHVICAQYNLDSAVSWKVYYDANDGAVKFATAVLPAPFTTDTIVSSLGTHDTLAINTWYTVYWAHNSVYNVYTIQIDDNPPQGLTTTNYAQVSTANFTIGSLSPSTTGGLISQAWDGDIDEVSIWDQCLTGPQVRQLVNGSLGIALADFDAHVEYEFCTSNPVTGEDLGDPLFQPIELDESTVVEKSQMPAYQLLFKLHDMDERITQILAGDSLVGWGVRFYMGFYDIAWASNCLQRFGGIIKEVQYEDGAYTVTAQSPFSAAFEKLIFNGASTQLTADMTDVATSCVVVDTAAFEAAANDPQSMRKLLECEGELFNYRDKDDTDFLSLIRPGATGFFVPPATAPSAAHAAGATVNEMIKLTSLSSSNANAASDDGLHPIEQLKLILTDTGKYGVGESGIGYNATQLAALKAALGAELQFRWIYADGVSAKEFLELEIYTACGMYPRCDNTGALGGKMFQGADDASPVDAITDDDIIAQPKWLRNAERIVNAVTVKLNYLPTVKTFPATFDYKDRTLIQEAGGEITTEIQSKGIRTKFSFGGNTWFETTEDFLIDMAQRLIARFGGKAPVLTVQTLFTKQLLEVGDDVSLTFSHAVNLGDGTRVMTDVPGEIISMKHDFDTGIVESQVLLYPV